MSLKQISEKTFPTQTPDTYDKIIIGGGPTALFTAYETLQAARRAGTPIKLAIVAETLNAPSFAGSQIFHGSDGSYVDGQDNATDKLFREGQSGLYEMLEREKIACREHKGLEIKAATTEEIKAFIDDIIAKNIFKPDEMRINTGDERMHFHDQPHSVIFEKVGQINTPDLVKGLAEKIKEMGGTIIEGARYESQTKNPDGTRTIHTSHGDMNTISKPLLATGAQHLLAQPELKDSGQTIWTMSLTLGPLSPEDYQKVAKSPSAFALLSDGSEIETDFPWGGFDEKGYLTFGMGDNPDYETVRRTEEKIMDRIKEYFPDIAQKYGHERHISLGAMLVTKNGQPTVGRFADYDVLGGWGGRGIVPGYAAAQAYAQYFVHNNDHKLKIFERMQPDLPFASNTPTQNSPTAKQDKTTLQP